MNLFCLLLLTLWNVVRLPQLHAASRTRRNPQIFRELHLHEHIQREDMSPGSGPGRERDLSGHKGIMDLFERRRRPSGGVNRNI